MTDPQSAGEAALDRPLWYRLFPRSLSAALVSVLLAFLAGGILIALVGGNPLVAYGTLFQSSLGSTNGLAETAIRTVPLALCGMGIALAFRAGVFNVGAEGQLYMGGIAAGYVGLQLAGAPQLLVLSGMALAGALAGAVWSGIAGVLKLRFRANELITTIMLNYIAIFLAAFLLHGPLKDPASPLAQTARLGNEARLPILLPATRLHAGILIVLVLAAAAQLFLWRTVEGLRFRAAGQNPRAAANAGMNVPRVLFAAFLLCGAFSGLAGFMEVAGVQRRMIENLSPGYGYTAIIVALLGDTNPFGVLLAAALFGALQIGSSTMESAAGIPGSLTTIIQALVVLFLIAQGAAPMLLRSIRRRRRAGSTP